MMLRREVPTFQLQYHVNQETSTVKIITKLYIACLTPYQPVPTLLILLYLLCLWFALLCTQYRTYITTTSHVIVLVWPVVGLAWLVVGLVVVEAILTVKLVLVALPPLQSSTGSYSFSLERRTLFLFSIVTVSTFLAGYSSDSVNLERRVLPLCSVVLYL